MKRTVNFKAVGILSLIVALFGVTVHFVHGFQVSRQSRDFLEQANRAERDGQPQETARLLGEYLGLVPDDVDSQFKYALALKDLAKTPHQKRQAYFVLENTLRRNNVERSDVRRAAAELGIQFRRFEESRKYLDLLDKSNPNDADLALLRGRCELGASNLNAATSSFRKAADLAPERVQLSVDVAMLLRDKRLDRPTIANEVMENLGTRGRPQDQAHEAAAKYFAQFGELAAAERQIQAAIAGTKTPTADQLLLATEVHHRMGHLAEARKFGERGRDEFPNDVRFAQRMAQIDLIEGQREQAKAQMNAVQQSSLERPEEILNAAEILIELGELDRARAMISKLEAVRAVAAANMLRGRLMMKQSAWGQARIELERARLMTLPPSLAKVAHFWLGECYERLGCVDQAQVAYRQALSHDRSWTIAQRALASVLASSGQIDRAIEEYRALLPEVPEVRLDLARLLLTRLRHRPASERDFSEVEEILRAIPKVDKPSPALALLQAELLMGKGKLDDAQKLAESERDRDPKRIEPWLMLAGLATQKQSGVEALAILTEAENQVGPSVDLELTRAKLWLSAPKIDATEQIKKVEAKIERFAGVEAVRLMAGLAECYTIVGDLPGARRLWQQIALRSPDNLTARFALFEAALQSANESDIEKCLSELLRIEGANGPLATYCEAAKHMGRAIRGNASALADARAPLAKAAELSPTWSRVVALQGQIYDLEGSHDKALEKYLEAIERGEGRLSVVRRTLQLLYFQRRFSEANAIVAKVSRQSLTDKGLGRIAAQLWVTSPTDEGSDPKVVRQRALELARQSVKADSRDYREYLWLGQVADLANEPAEAEKSYRHAKLLEPTAADTWVALVAFLARSDRNRADLELESAKQLVAASQLSLVLAPCFEALGRWKEAAEQYRAALATRPEDVVILRSAANFFSMIGQPDQSIPLFRKLLEPNTRSPESTLSWARRSLAMTIAASGNHQQFREALALIDANGATLLQDRLAKAVILAMQPGNRREALRFFEEISPQLDALHPDVRFVAAQLYEADGNWGKARPHMRILIKDHDKNAVYLIRYIRGLLRHDGVGEAAELVDRLAVLRPNSLEAAELKSRVLKAQGRPNAEVVEAARLYLQNKDARPELAALLFESCGALTEAESILRQHITTATKPEAVLLLAGFLSRQKQLPEALAVCEKAWANCSPEAVASCAVAALRLCDGDNARYRQVEQWIEAAIAKHPKSTMLVTLLGMLKESLGQSDDAIALYRQVLQRDSQNVVALNNLACLLALNAKADEAVILINQAIDLAGPDAELLDSRALVHLQLGQQPLALRDVQQAISQVATPSKSLNYRLAQVYLAGKNRTAAADAMRKAKELGLQVNDLAFAERPGFKKALSELD